ncbi:hypothetical protein PUV54_07850 [Hyphococcus flavus]|uniref:Uncharacterized protein n=1 Tax=Hyphococcus flavus TaxID=1866326 RepID=A0AAE9ZHE2_9PROT|nr:hypothetical protein [Hyphococcus flavus]WDI33108.1 hypothetical protein PUV54_07850 [Hyphococcus flavus]
MFIKQAFAGIAAALALGAGVVAQDFGPSPANYEALVVDYFGERLTEPTSARYQFISEPYQVFADVSGYEGLPCWAVDVRVKSRLPNGTYGGYVPYTVIILDGEPIALEDEVIQMVRA